MTKRCDEFRDLLAGYRDGELSPRDAERVAGHVAGCPECASALARDEEIETVLADSVVPRASGDWEALAQGIEDALAREVAASKRAGQRPRPRFAWALTPRRLAFGSLGTLMVAALVFLLHPWQRELAPELAAPPAALPSLPPEAPAPQELRGLGYIDGAPSAPAEGVVGRDTAGAGRAAPAEEHEVLAAAPSAAPAAPPPAAKATPTVRSPEPLPERSAELSALAREPEPVASRAESEVFRKEAKAPLPTADAWAASLALDAETALNARNPGEILPIAVSMDAFLEAYPRHEDAASIREQQVRVWARLATIDPKHCVAALARARAWEQSLGGPARPETEKVVAELRSGPCGE